MKMFGRPFVKRFALCYRTVAVCLSCLSVTLAYCGQTVGWIRMPLGMEVGLGPGHIALDGDLAPLQKGGTAAPTFRPVSILAKRSPVSAIGELLLLTNSNKYRFTSNLKRLSFQKIAYHYYTCRGYIL